LQRFNFQGLCFRNHQLHLGLQPRHLSFSSSTRISE
jgi:hypothetical protein